MFKKAACVILLSASLAAENAPSKPKITSEQRAQFWRAQAEQLAAQMRLEMANRQLQAIREAMAKSCGDDVLVSSPDGEPVCQAKPAETPKK